MSVSGGDGDEPTGFGKPPKHSRFRKGQSGNPGGRPRKTDGKPANLAQLLGPSVDVTIKGKRKKVSWDEAFLRKNAQHALAGNTAVQKDFLEQLEKYDLLSAKWAEIPPLPIKRTIVYPKSSSTKYEAALEALGVLKRVGDKLKIEAWVLEAARAQSPNSFRASDLAYELFDRKAEKSRVSHE